MTDESRPGLCLLSGRVHPQLAVDIATALGVKLGDVKLGTFANGETSCKLLESVRGKDVFVIQSHWGVVGSSQLTVDGAIMEQALIIDAAKRASARSITALCPFMGYGRQDRKASGREPIAARLVVDLLSSAGADRIMGVDLHSGQTQGFFNGPFDHVIAMPVLREYLRQTFGSDLVIVSPDAGRVKVAERWASALGCGMAIIHKHRSTTEHNVVEARHLIGDVADKVCVVIDDMIDTAGTICAAADRVMEEGAREVYGVTTHGVLSGPALERIQTSAFARVIMTDTLPVPDGLTSKIQVLSVAPLLAQAITAVVTGDSVSEIFEGANQI